MEKDEIKLSDIARILFGEAPAIYLLEVLARSLVAYIALLLVIKLLGKRMSGRLTSTEMAVMLMFGAIVSSAMQIPDRGVLEGIFVLFLVLLIQRMLTLWTVKKIEVENRVLGKMSTLVREGVLQVDALEAERITRHQLFAKLRTKEIKQLGEIKRLYMEVNGSLSMYKQDPSQPGLSVLPPEDAGIHKEEQVAKGKTVCHGCGMLYPEDQVPGNCRHCNDSHFVPAITAIK
jgi:uncharacterized membrane protein YcaP (DUF421 family)